MANAAHGLEGCAPLCTGCWLDGCRLYRTYIPEKRLRRAELQIDKFLKETSPDRFSGSFFDAYTEQEGKLLISLLEEQKTWHEGVNSSIVLNHESELIRLRAEIKQAEDLIRKVDAEIDLLQAIYDRMNR